MEAVAVSFLHSYANPAHEEAAADILREHLPGVTVTTASSLTREWRECERTSTAALNAYVQPVASAYLRSLTGDLRDAGVHAPLYGMTSNGGRQTFAVLEEQPIHLVESGPVGGVIGAAAIGNAIGMPNLITLDIGGTTVKCALQDNGPVVDIVEIGAGGGSIAWIDQGGALKIGPKSAGSVPGPACYGKGGIEPTVTDANLIVGRINPDYFLDSEIEVSVDLARQAMAPIAKALGVSVDEAALGVIRLANANMINALKLVSVRRGYDPRDFASAGFDPADVVTERCGDLRYLGQEHTVQVPFPDDPVDIAAVNEAFHALHERAYTFRLDSPIEIVNFHVVGRVATPKPSLAGAAYGGSGRPKGRRMVDFDESGRLETTIYERADLAPGVPIAGPAVRGAGQHHRRLPRAAGHARSARQPPHRNRTTQAGELVSGPLCGMLLASYRRWLRFRRGVQGSVSHRLGRRNARQRDRQRSGRNDLRDRSGIASISGCHS